MLFNRIKKIVFMIDCDLIETALHPSCVNPGPIVTQETIYRSLDRSETMVLKIDCSHDTWEEVSLETHDLLKYNYTYIGVL